MDLTTILLTVIVLILCALPIAVMQRNKTRKEKAFKETIAKLAGNDNCKIDVLDRWNNNGIAIDRNNGKLFFISMRNAKTTNKVIDLSDIAQSILVKAHHHIKSEDSGGLRKLEIHLVPKDKGKQNIALEFYDAEHDSLTIGDELQLAEKWSAIVEAAVPK